MTPQEIEIVKDLRIRMIRGDIQAIANKLNKDRDVVARAFNPEYTYNQTIVDAAVELVSTREKKKAETAKVLATSNA